MSPEFLAKALQSLPPVAHPNLLVGFGTSDDAGVYKLTQECALVQTVDFFTPVVDDPYTFGAIAAANSLSDVYAMGGRPLTALSILCYPGQGELETLTEILRGGAEKMAEAGCLLVGGHSVADEDIKFGYSVTGTVHPEKIKANSGARVGDFLVLTKALGTGVIATALKRGVASEEWLAASTASMLTLNRSAAEALADFDTGGVTDITGFGLLGHAREMAEASQVTLVFEGNQLPLLPGAREAAEAGTVPGGLKNNRNFVSPHVSIGPNCNPTLVTLAFDPQTSGGLLVSLAPGDVEEYCRRSGGTLIGEVIPRQEHLLWLR
ncbi:MAG: selenide, water dikinase SelD [Bryobacter sp.]|nr:selenide, water dikinase SelD [Bryobacter sp.]